MLATSWKAKGLVKPIWHRLPVQKGKREELARLTGLQASDLSALNTGNRAMTLDVAQRIADAVEGVTIYDLGAPATAEGDEGPLLLQRLARLEASSENLTTSLELLTTKMDALLVALGVREDDADASPALPTRRLSLGRP